MPLLTWIVMIEPGIVWPLGDVPTTAPYGAVLLTGVGLVGDLEAGVLEALARRVHAPCPATLGTREPGAPST